jgi:hypothetical protein
MDRIAKILQIPPLSDEELLELEKECSETLKFSKNNQKGVLNSHYGRKHSEETKFIISCSAKNNKRRVGKKHTENSKLKMRESALNRPSNRKGKSPWNKGIPHSEMTKKKISEKKTGVKRAKSFSEKMKNISKKREKNQCGYCHSFFDKMNYSKWHGENCKNREKLL